MQKVKSIATKRRGRISKIKFYLGKDNLELVSFFNTETNIAIRIFIHELYIINNIKKYCYVENILI